MKHLTETDQICGLSVKVSIPKKMDFGIEDNLVFYLNSLEIEGYFWHC